MEKKSWFSSALGLSADKIAGDTWHSSAGKGIHLKGIDDNDSMIYQNISEIEKGKLIIKPYEETSIVEYRIIGSTFSARAAAVPTTMERLII